MTDPLAELVAALREGRAVPLAWVVRWSEGGRDPVAAAWHASRNGWRMLGLLRGWVEAGLVSSPEVFTYYNRVIWSGKQLADLADELRRLCPVPPTLAELLERTKRTKASDAAP